MTIVDRIALIDWDESHVDAPDLDLVLPNNDAGLEGGAHDIAARWLSVLGQLDDLAVRVGVAGRARYVSSHPQDRPGTPQARTTSATQVWS